MNEVIKNTAGAGDCPADMPQLIKNNEASAEEALARELIENTAEIYSLVQLNESARERKRKEADERAADENRLFRKI